MFQFQKTSKSHDGKYYLLDVTVMRKIVLISILIFSALFCIGEAVAEEDKALIENYVWANDSYIDLMKTTVYEIEYKVKLKKTATGTITKLKVRLPIIQDFLPIQEVLEMESFPPCKEIKIDKIGNKYAFYQFMGMGAEREILLKYKVRITGYRIKNKVVRELKTLNFEETIPSFFVSPEKYIESDNPKILELASSICDNEMSVWEKTWEIYRYASKSITYELTKEDMGALYSLENSKGDCVEFASLMTALCRACGIPARTINSTFCHNSKETSDTFHFSVEVFLPKVGWANFDPTVGRHKGNWRKYFASKPNDSITWVMSRSEFTEGYGRCWYWYWYSDYNPNIEMNEDVKMIRVK